MDRPLLFIDIDGVISLFAFDAYLSATAAALLLELGECFELVWCSGWEDRADEHLPPALGLPAGLHPLSFGDPDPAAGRHWKLAAIEDYAGPDRPLAWIDDAHDDS